MSKRLQSLIDAWVASHILVEEYADRMDPSFSVSHRIQVPLLVFAASLLAPDNTARLRAAG